MIKQRLDKTVPSIALVCILSGLCTGYPVFEDDYTVSETSLAAVDHQYAMYLRSYNEEMPKPCRTDLCLASYNSSDRKGDFHWPEISIGEQVQLRCPYSFHSPVYTTKVCSIGAGGEVQWELSDFEEVCPDPPLAELVKQFDKEAANSSVTLNKLYYESLLARVHSVFTLYRDTPMDFQDVSQLVYYLTQAMDVILDRDGGSVSNLTADNLVHVLDSLMEEDLYAMVYLALMNLNYHPRLNVHLANLPLLVDTDNYHIKLSNILVYTATVTVTETTEAIDVHNVFEFTVNDSITVYSPNVSILVMENNIAGQDLKVGMTIVKDVSFLNETFIWLKVPTEPDNNEYGDKRRNANGPSSTTTPSSNVIQMFDTTHPVYESFKNLGSIMFVNYKLYSSLDISDNIKIAYNTLTCMSDGDTCLDQWDTYRPSCVKSSEPSNYSIWSRAECVEQTNQANSLEFNINTYCQCNGVGAFSVFIEESGNSQLNPPPPGAGPPGMDDDTEVVEGDISSFLGFPYRKELEIIGNILGVISLACLIATVLSYSVFRNTRRGSPTTILLNLCVALIILSTMLFAINLSGSIMNMTGCTVSNALRYYLIFVTLMWNAVEAFNMYLMLIKVFDSNVSYFAVKAGIIAWGIPGVMVGVCFAVSNKAFNGEFVLVSESLGECVFKCQLRSGTLYYGYLIPMFAIILHNLIIFGFVLKAIIKHGNRTGHTTKENRRIQLIGAVATLALLGIPWLFSAFGAIDAAKDDRLTKMEGVFQVIFVLTVNVQGVFIFIFHCARNQQMRQSWSSIVRGSSFRTKSTDSTASFSKSSSSKRKPPIPVDTVTVMPDGNQTYNHQKESPNKF